MRRRDLLTGVAVASVAVTAPYVALADGNPDAAIFADVAEYERLRGLIDPLREDQNRRWGQMPERFQEWGFDPREDLVWDLFRKQGSNFCARAEYVEYRRLYIGTGFAEAQDHLDRQFDKITAVEARLEKAKPQTLLGTLSLALALHRMCLDYLPAGTLGKPGDWPHDTAVRCQDTLALAASLAKGAVA